MFLLLIPCFRVLLWKIDFYVHKCVTAVSKKNPAFLIKNINLKNIMNTEQIAAASAAAAATAKAATATATATSPPRSPPTYRVKRCEFKGCKKTSNDCKIINHGCPVHHSFMKQKNTKQRIANYAKKKAILRKQFDFTSCSKLVNNADFMKYDSYKTDVIKAAAINKGKLLVLTGLEKTPYLSLKKNGVALIEDAIEIDDTAYQEFLDYVQSESSKFQPLFTTINKNGSPKFIMEKGPNRYSIGGENCNLENWNNIHFRFQSMFKRIKVPNKGHPSQKPMYNLNFDFNIIKSDGGLTRSQQPHTDELHPFSLGNTTKFFNFVTLTGIEKETLFYIQPIGMVPQLVLIERGDTIVFRMDIPHAGAENLTDNPNLRLHSFVSIQEWELPHKTGHTQLAVHWNVVPSVKWDASNLKFNVV